MISSRPDPIDHTAAIEQLVQLQLDVAVHLRDLHAIFTHASNSDLIELRDDIHTRLDVLIEALETD